MRDKLYSWLNDIRLTIAPDETTPQDERAESLAQLDIIDDIMEWLEKNEQEPKQGHWIWDAEKTYCKCSECGIGMGHTEFDFCPNCGCRMSEVEQ